LWIAFNTNSLQPYQRDPFGRSGASHPPTSLLPLPEGDAQLDAPQPARRRGTELRRVREVYSFSKCLEAPVEAYP
jgi:hypothetical protein